ncbi:hypothetical protein EIN_141410 [Entamoeba invadens IP1]|uniref:Hexosyltransferase n=1 Tax=Entamoeba invadens IP1 TaxID=370355 RepID=A0A0A1UGZ3_ENTIV|nr:hypothetical protein EIN_141410 [Entamoeba invadens IP1]ELP95299.1 hypothetical protein EIN_141410 [Entamoeba invadens IP1]|eukprot:XP_004262070.1 hypothetical protein EIN_141410 [Entamoeba invadens IP1]
MPFVDIDAPFEFTKLPIPVVPQNNSTEPSATEYYKKIEHYISTNYGPYFTLDESYPLQVDVKTYATLKLKYEQPIHINNTQYPKKLLLAMIHTMPNKAQNIINIRNTWCQEKHELEFGFKCIFILVRGSVTQANKTKLFKEMNMTKHDIYFVDMPFLNETWNTLYQKDIASYIFMYPIFKGYKFYGRFDNHVVVNVDMLCDLLIELPTEGTVFGHFYFNNPKRNKKSKYYDMFAQPFKKYYPFVAGYIALYSNDMAEYFSTWDKYFQIPPSSLEDTPFGFLSYKYAMEKHMKLTFVFPKQIGTGTSGKYGKNYIIFHRGRETDLVQYYNKCVEDGHFVN